MRYCFFTSGDWTGNASLIRPIQLGAALIERGVEVGYVLDDVPANHGDVGVHPNAKRLYVKRTGTIDYIREHRRVLREFNPDYVAVLNPHPRSFLAPVGTKHKIVGEWDEPPTVKEFLPWHKRIMFSFIDRWLARRAVVRNAVTHYVADWLREHRGVETNLIPHAPYLKNYPDGVSPFDEPAAVYMGNFFVGWDHDITFEAARILQHRGKTPRIVLMGHGPDMPTWEKFVAENGLHNVTLAGFLTGEELWLRLRHAHVLLFPIRPNILNLSRLPSKVFAYAQARRPILTNRVGEIPHLLGEKPTYIDCTANAFADAIDAAMSAPRAPDVEYNLEQHNWGERADRLLEAIKEYESRRNER